LVYAPVVGGSHESARIHLIRLQHALATHRRRGREIDLGRCRILQRVVRYKGYRIVGGGSRDLTPDANTGDARGPVKSDEERDSGHCTGSLLLQVARRAAGVTVTLTQVGRKGGTLIGTHHHHPREAEIHYSPHKQALAALVAGMRRFEQLLLPQHFFLRGPEGCLGPVLQAARTRGIYNRWKMFLQDFQFTFLPAADPDASGPEGLIPEPAHPEPELADLGLEPAPPASSPERAAPEPEPTPPKPEPAKAELRGTHRAPAPEP